MVGRPGLNPGTLGLKGSSRTLRGDALVSNVVCFQGLWRNPDYVETVTGALCLTQI